MSTINLQLEQIKDEDFINYEQGITNVDFLDDHDKLFYEVLCDSPTSLLDCGKVVLNLESNLFSFCCVFCETAFRDAPGLFEHITSSHILDPYVKDETNEAEDWFEGAKLEFAGCNKEEIVPSNSTTELFNEKSLSKPIQYNAGNTTNPNITTSNKPATKKKKLPNAKNNELLPFKCIECPKTFGTMENLTYHSAVHNQIDDEYKCIHCDQVFSKKRYLQMHLNYHLTDKLHTCPTCGKQSRTSHQLKIHMLKHSSLKQFVCEICGISYRLRHHLVTHQKQIHENKREYKCNKCDRAFNTQGFLNTHKLLHMNERNHTCEICLASFVWKKNLQEHIKLHLDVKGYKCEICGKRFAQRAGLITHRKSHVVRITSG